MKRETCGGLKDVAAAPTAQLQGEKKGRTREGGAPKGAPENAARC
jgi:hypothetical protein